MNKKLLAILLILVGVIVLTVGVLQLVNSDRHTGKTTASNNSKRIIKKSGGNMGKTLVVYYSAQKHTDNVAKKVAANLGADIFAIVPEQVYTEADLDWNDSSSRVSREHNDPALRNVALKTKEVPNWSEYGTVLIGYPIWWGIAAWPTDAFVSGVDWKDKTVIPFCTSHSSGVGNSDTVLKNKANGGDWKAGFRFSQSASDSDIKAWTDSLTK